jgi:hypothetical protein
LHPPENTLYSQIHDRDTHFFRTVSCLSGALIARLPLRAKLLPLLRRAR